MYKVRFNLGRGKNYKKWKVTNPDKTYTVYDPEEVRLVLTGCVLKNRRHRAQEIFEGSNKSICAWILCETIQVLEKDVKVGPEVSYNPRKVPHWSLNNKDVDGEFFTELVTNSKRVFIPDGNDYNQ